MELQRLLCPSQGTGSGPDPSDYLYIFFKERDSNSACPFPGHRGEIYSFCETGHKFTFRSLSTQGNFLVLLHRCKYTAGAMLTECLIAILNKQAHPGAWYNYTSKYHCATIVCPGYPGVKKPHKHTKKAKWHTQGQHIPLKTGA